MPVLVSTLSWLFIGRLQAAFDISKNRVLLASCLRLSVRKGVATPAGPKPRAIVIFLSDGSLGFIRVDEGIC